MKEYIKGKRRIRLIKEDGHVKIECYNSGRLIVTYTKPFNDYKNLVKRLRMEWMGLWN